METTCIQTITFLYIYFCVWGLDLRLNNTNLHQLFLLILLITYHHYLLILRLWNTTKFKYHNHNVYTDYIHSDNKEIIITTNKVIASSDLDIVKKELDNVDLNDVISPQILQSKLYLKILDILYFRKTPIYLLLLT